MRGCAGGAPGVRERTDGRSAHRAPWPKKRCEPELRSVGRPLRAAGTRRRRRKALPQLGRAPCRAPAEHSRLAALAHVVRRLRAAVAPPGSAGTPCPPLTRRSGSLGCCYPQQGAAFAGVSWIRTSNLMIQVMCSTIEPSLTIRLPSEPGSRNTHTRRGDSWCVRRRSTDPDEIPLIDVPSPIARRSWRDADTKKAPKAMASEASAGGV